VPGIADRRLRWINDNRRPAYFNGISPKKGGCSMSLHSLLVPITGQPADELALEAAFALVRGSQSHISVVCTRPNPNDVMRYAVDWSYPILTSDAVAAAERHSATIQRKASAMFERWRLTNDLPIAATPSECPGVSVSWQDHVGASDQIVGDLARFADMTVMLSPGDRDPFDAEDMLEAALFDAGRPVLLIPGKPVASTSRTALIAWDGAREVLRAITAALPLLAPMATVHILTVDAEDGDGKPEALATYLAWHGIATDVHHATRGPMTIGETVIREASKIDAELVVMGGYHHSRTREILFGGTTRDIIFSSTVPILLAH
jgi:nucleotide-binding universal stress UspA family protein